LMAPLACGLLKELEICILALFLSGPTWMIGLT
jgi:hypothetical protein